MRRKMNKNAVIGIVLILVGLLWAGNILGICSVNFYFKGWWTTFIWLPSLVGLLTSDRWISSLEGVIIGLILLACERGMLVSQYVPTLVVSSLFVAFGLHLIFDPGKTEKKKKSTEKEIELEFETEGYHFSSDDFFATQQENEEAMKHDAWNQQDNYSQQAYAKYEQENGDYENRKQGNSEQEDWGKMGSHRAYQESQSEQTDAKQDQNKQNEHNNKNTQREYHNYSNQGEMMCPASINACLVGKAYSSKGEEFHGTSIQTILGNVQLDLREARVLEDCIIHVNLILGGMNIYLPNDVRVNVSCQNILAEVRDLRQIRIEEGKKVPSITIIGNCILGGLELK